MSDSHYNLPATNRAQAASSHRATETFRPDGFLGVTHSDCEFDAKTPRLGRPFAVNAAVYAVDWRDMQYTLPTSNRAGRFLANVGRARGYGVELDAQWRFAREWRATLSTAYTDIRLVEQQQIGSTIGPGRYGDRLPIVPHWRGTAGMEYERPFSAAQRVRARLDGNYVSSAYTGFARSSTEFSKLDAVALFDARVSWHVDNETPWSIGAFATNLLNRRANTNVLSNLSGPPQASGPAPRSIGVSFEWQLQ